MPEVWTKIDIVGGILSDKTRTTKNHDLKKVATPESSFIYMFMIMYIRGVLIEKQ